MSDSQPLRTCLPATADSKAVAGFFSNLDRRKLGASFSWLLADRCLRLGISFFVGVLVVRYLGPGDFGRLSYALSCLTLFGAVVPLGLDAIAKREIVSAPGGVSRVLSTVLVVRAVALGACLMAGLAILPAFEHDDRMLLVAAAGALFAPIASSFDLVLEAHLRGKAAFVARSAATAGGAFVRLALVVVGAPVIAFAAAVSIEAVLLMSCLAASMRRLGIAWSPALFEFSTAARLLRESWPLIFAGLAVVLYGRIDQVMLQSYCGETEVGRYSAAVRLAELAYVVPMLLASTLYPALIQARNSDVISYRDGVRRVLDLNAGISYAIAVVISVGAPWWMLFAYGATFSPASNVLAIYSWAGVFVFLGVARSHVLSVEGLTMIQLTTTGLGAIVNVALNALLIPRYGGVGAAWATVAAQATAAWLSLAMFRRTRWLFAHLSGAVLFPVLGWRLLRSGRRSFA